MPRPRFDRLPAQQQSAILDVALREFAARGYRDASLNHIIEQAGLSKGSMYYYFDGKEDLYAHVIRAQLGGLLEEGGPIPLSEATDPDVFWATLEDSYLDLMRMLAASPQTAALLRDWLSGPASPSLRDAQQDAEAAYLPWLLDAAAAGQHIGAVRADVPTHLLLAVVMGMGQAMDTWLITQTRDDADLAETVHVLIDMMRRVAAP